MHAEIAMNERIKAKRIIDSAAELVATDRAGRVKRGRELTEKEALECDRYELPRSLQSFAKIKEIKQEKIYGTYKNLKEVAKAIDTLVQIQTTIVNNIRRDRPETLTWTWLENRDTPSQQPYTVAVDRASGGDRTVHIVPYVSDIVIRTFMQYLVYSRTQRITASIVPEILYRPATGVRVGEISRIPEEGLEIPAMVEIPQESLFNNIMSGDFFRRIMDVSAELASRLIEEMRRQNYINTERLLVNKYFEQYGGMSLIDGLATDIFGSLRQQITLDGRPLRG